MLESPVLWLLVESEPKEPNELSRSIWVDRGPAASDFPSWLLLVNDLTQGNCKSSQPPITTLWTREAHWATIRKSRVAIIIEWPNRSISGVASERQKQMKFDLNWCTNCLQLVIHLLQSYYQQLTEGKWGEIQAKLTNSPIAPMAVHW